MLLALVFLPFPALASSSVTLAWSPGTDPNIAGYNIYYGGASGTYTNKLSVGDVTSATISGLVEGKTYYFAATTYSATGLESPFSSEISYQVPPNQPPTLDAISNLSINENAGLQTVGLSGISSGAITESQKLTVTAASSNPGLIPNPTVHYTSPSTTGSLTFSPAVNRIGMATITVTVNDGGASNNIVTRKFTVTVTANTKAATSGRRPLLGCQLTNQAALIGQNKTFAIKATGIGALRYQWTFNGAALPGAVNSVLLLKNVTTNQAGVYSVTVTDRNGSTNSTARLTVYTTMAAALAPAIQAGGQYAFTVAGVPGYKYVVQASTNLINWVPVQTNIAPFTFADANAGKFSQRFYRSVYAP
ncbi:MAG: fibronectin type III domain-containing protein [Limisphaerales bacterium]